MKESTRESFSEFLEFELEAVVSENVKRYVKESGYTALDLSIRSNLSLATINRLKAGQNLSVRSICALAEVLNKAPCSFFVRQN